MTGGSTSRSAFDCCFPFMFQTYCIDIAPALLTAPPLHGQPLPVALVRNAFKSVDICSRRTQQVLGWCGSTEGH